ncbi:MAG: hypothetical protein IJW77_17955 [Clostridia bacterium]|nr:hypothetical protein [Clostridia bacterium]
MKRIIKIVCLVLVVLIVAAAYFSRTLENLTLTEVELVSHHTGTLTFKDESYIPEIVRVRCVGDIVLEDIYVGNGENVVVGDPIASVYPAALDRALLSDDLTTDERSWYTAIRENGYRITAAADGFVVHVPPSPDDSLTAEAVLYKYIPAGIPLEMTYSEAYDVIVPMRALKPTEEDGKYLIYYADPLTGRGEAGQYTVLVQEVRVIASDGEYAALDTVVWDGRKIIVPTGEMLYHQQIVKVG